MIAIHLKNIGVQKVFGVPGGGSSLDLIDAFDNVDIDFHLVKREDAAVIMASVFGEITRSIDEELNPATNVGNMVSDLKQKLSS